jgi:hypothetical protein
MKTLKKLNLILFLALAGLVIGCSQGNRGEQAEDEAGRNGSSEYTY